MSPMQPPVISADRPTHGLSARTLLRQGLERLLVHSGAASILRHRRGRRRLILAYHNILPAGCPSWGERSLHLPVEWFREHLAVLTKSANLVSLNRILDPTPLDDPRPAVAMTFDDGYGGTVEAMQQLLVPRGIPSTVFVDPGHPAGHPFWWDVLASSASPSGGIPEPTRNRCLTEFRGDRARVLEWAGTQWTLEEAPPDPAYLAIAPEALPGLFGDSALVQVGSHGWSHSNLVALSPEDRVLELVRPLRWLAEQGLGAGCGISYPYGLTDPEVAEAAREAGYPWGLKITGGFLDDRGWEGDLLALPRLNVPAGLTHRGLALRLAGIGAS